MHCCKYLKQLIFIVLSYYKLTNGESLEQCSSKTNTFDEDKCGCRKEHDKNNRNYFYDASSKDYYFDSYAHFGIHEDMLKDEARTLTYRSAILNNKHLFKDKVVLDVGCGTGILSLFAAQAGAAKVIGIDCSNIVDFAIQIVKDNKFDDVVTIVKGKVEELTELPDGIKEVDIILSEWMGYCLLFESMLQTVLYARDKWLKKGGLLFPDKAKLYLAAIEDRHFKSDKINWWDNVYGFNMSVIKKVSASEPLVDYVGMEKVITSEQKLIELDLYTVTEEDLSFSTTFSLRVRRNDYIHALTSYFSVHFMACHVPLSLSTAPDSQLTHWKQVIFYLDGEIIANEGELLNGVFTLKQNLKEKRDLDIDIVVNYEGDLTDLHETNSYRLR